ncbi:hypothetical protein SALBM217S_00393 [Streptomyces griseoloalbus]
MHLVRGPGRRRARRIPGPARADTADLARSCELVIRLALSCVVAPSPDDGVAELVRGALHRQPVP